nr:MAG TPA: hypothetical protein [Caudoviricetes sp.]
MNGKSEHRLGVTTFSFLLLRPISYLVFPELNR